MVEVELAAVRVDLQSNTPVVLLRELGGERRTLPIFIAAPEATAIAFALQGVRTPRPMTHDLLRDVLEALGARLDRVVITELREKTYYAELQLSGPGGPRVVSSRPSDAIALAARTGSPLFVVEEVIDAEGLIVPDEAEEDDESATSNENPEELVERFRGFLEEVRPEDFQA
jgi:bifunctional DNase/RNase